MRDEQTHQGATHIMQGLERASKRENEREQEAWAKLDRREGGSERKEMEGERKPQESESERGRKKEDRLMGEYGSIGQQWREGILAFIHQRFQQFILCLK